ncbi:MAG: type II secretion system ATPase GspE [Desulfobia sp.]
MTEHSPPQRPSYSFARRHGLLVTGYEGDTAWGVCSDNTALHSKLELRRFLGTPVKLETVSREHFESLLQEAYQSSSSEAELIAHDLSEDMDLQSIAQQLSEPKDLLESQDDAPIIRLINGLLSQAIKENASDIHIEPFENQLRVRFRIDGILQEALQPISALAPLIISRIKVMARLDIAEKRLPQDGRISLKIAGRSVDVRVSTIPAGHGERIVLRLLDKQAGRLNLEQLGMASDTMQKIDRLIHRPNGILLVTGPTGSGKTTTLYAALTRLNDKSRNIMTVEDPIEYYLEGIGQTQVHSKVKMTFARGLRAILRQDPDVIMVGEIRDLETAEVAVQASLTGHLVISTLHTNTAVGAVVRLRDMGVKPFLLSSSLIGVLAQRLVRILCPHCKVPYQPTAAELKDFDLPVGDNSKIFKKGGCEKCNFQGYIGRTGIYELVEVDGYCQSLIHNDAGNHELESHARTRTPSIRQDGWRRIKAGDTSVEEVLRVTRES